MTPRHKKKAHILIVEDNQTMRSGMSEILKKAGYNIVEASNGHEGLACINKQTDIVITDYKMPGLNGIDFLKKIKEKMPAVEVIVITAYGTIELAIEAMKAGAWDFITKPFSKDELHIKVDRLTAMLQERDRAHHLAEENKYLKETLNLHFNYGEIIGESPLMKQVYKTISKVAKNDTSVLIYGESGTGKELVAHAIHQYSHRKQESFIRVNCGALAESVLESELFGHERGAFTGALKRRKGRFELANHGTLFLDEIGDLPLGTQIKLLRVLQEREFELVGGEETIQVDVRVIAATHRNLLQEVQAGRFREDLYYRLHIFPIYLPPLEKRKEDIPLLANHFLKRFGKEMQKPNIHLLQDGLKTLTAYNWPGNVRELENVLERAVVLSEGEKIDAKDLSFISTERKGTKIAQASLDLEDAVSALEKEMLQKALAATKGVKAQAAKLLGIKEGTLYYKLEKYGLIEKEKNK